MRSAVDDLLDKLELRTSPLAALPQRNTDPSLLLMAAFCLTNPGLIDSEFEVVARHSGLGCRELRKTVTGARSLDRKASFVGGFPWTDAKNPWPRSAESGQWLSPIIQLNMRDIGLDMLGLPQDVLVQVWGNGIEPLVRTLMLDDLAPGGPDPDFKPFQNPHLSFQFEGTDWGRAEPAPTELCDFDGRIFAELTKPNGDWNLWYPCDLTDDPYIVLERLEDKWSEVVERELRGLAERMRATQKAADKTRQRPPPGWRNAFGYFGGFAVTRQAGIEPDGVHVLTPERTCSDRGLNILFDGSVSLKWMQNKGAFEVNAGR